MSNVILVILGAIAGACAMYLWCARARITDAFTLSVLASLDDSEVRLVIDERTYAFEPTDAHEVGNALLIAAGRSGKERSP